MDLQKITQPRVSFIIPVYNEEYNIQSVFRDLYEVVERHPEWRAEVIVIEDGSTDRTRKVLTELCQQYPATRLIIHEKNLGYNQSMRDGIGKACGDFLMYIGADEEFDCSEIPAFIEPLLDETDPYDVVLGVRWQRNAYRLHRFFISVIYIFLLNGMFRLRVNDYNWSQVWSRRMLEQMDIDSHSLFMLPEIIIKAHDLGYRVKETPSNHRGRRYGKSSLNMKIMGGALLDAFRFWLKRGTPGYFPARRGAEAAFLEASREVPAVY